MHADESRCFQEFAPPPSILISNIPSLTSLHRKSWFMSAGVHLIDRLPNSVKNAQRPKASETSLKRFLVSNAFYSVDEFLAFNWKTAQFDDFQRWQWVEIGEG
ncbi:hypothetical protein J6590_085022 [Homalodisca vitripennis]|nr:hypothetical protein J6590_085022 [Homalodisca vitripennis]